MKPANEKNEHHSRFQFISSTRIFGQRNVKLAVGMKAPDWMFTNSEKKEFTMDYWAGKVIRGFRDF